MNNSMVIDGFYPEVLYNNFLKLSGQQYYKRYNPDFPGSDYWALSTLPYEQHTPNEELTKTSLEMLDFFKSKFPTNGKLFSSFINVQPYGHEPQPHFDHMFDDSVTVINYIVDKWSINWGGETVLYNLYREQLSDEKWKSKKYFMDNIDIDRSVIPRRNRILIVKGHQLHCAKPVSKFFTDSRITFMYKMRGVTFEELTNSYIDK